ncbi:MAG: LLM class flavin-dependent oxidoreductase, partial [Gammaproteobacteria bacterium]
IHNQEKLTDYQTNPNLAVVGGFMCAETDEEAWEKADGWTFFQFALGLYNKEGPFAPGEVNIWERYQEWKATPAGQRRSGSELIGSPATIRERLRELQAAHVDQVILLNQAGRNTHQDICDSLELFAREVMPEFQADEANHQAWKQGVLNKEIELEVIDTEPFNITSRQAPTQAPTAAHRDMVSGSAGRPAAKRVS